LGDIFSTCLNNFEEEYHSHIESNSIQYLDFLKQEDLSFYQQEEQAMNFLLFISEQYFRTKKMRSAIEKIPSQNLKTIWPILRHIHASQMALNLYTTRDRYTLVLLKNGSHAPLLTGDQPIINTKVVPEERDKPPEKLEMYYPVSPKLAVLLTEKEKGKTYSPTVLHYEEVERYNRMIVAHALEQVYSNCKPSLEFFSKQARP